ncbi:electron transport complex subunit RsxC [Vibrio cholerae]|uniref:electron transport complex subunit RsxC n=6 Tax=Vibrio cholerae TaxID=666 RepID=UPI00021A93EB|nr:electron transport complex subunit RsxC [Vibrio cholerae]EGS63372.1 electron transport complex, RnfABCDGE type, C subunit [Vibrio cholerae HC-02A1]EKF9155436.1 electron transport complex subunit RsxC [Vibrio cholerae]EKF9386388.1 electron transport complex subunit RsxC [Vibrio cholerae]EKF9821707.1 electron transport complex subunit RsxC [Vibrio cholerae]EKG57523.1 electron transport complex, RnfABCDGE type, C subunit [Vibrio cholerae HC-52A1]
MLSLIEQIKSGKLWDFPGGIHPFENKHQSNRQPIINASIPNELVLPLKQHIGKAGDLLVKVGDRVLKGQPLTQYTSTFMLPIHAPTSGVISAIEPRTVAHPSGLSELCIVLTPDQQEEWFELQPQPDYQQLSPETLLELIRQAGISGMGGAGFPTAKKLQSGLSRTEILIINAAECEPYITADDVLMRQYAHEIIQGIEIVEHILKPKLTIIGIEDNKPEAVAALQQAAQDKPMVIRVIPTKYPSGGEKQLIKILTNLEVPKGGIPADIGLMVQNVGSLQAIARAIVHGEPLIRRVVTLTGNCFRKPRNVWALLGTPVQALLNEFGYKADKKLPRLIMGGPMMGFTLPHAQVPITKTANCILAPTRNELTSSDNEMACIRCGQCAEACPVSLLPQQLQWHAKAEEFDKCEELNLKDCIECGACAYVCPSEIPLVQYYRQAKAEIRTRSLEAEAAERAKARFEEKKARMERDKAERENRFKQAAEDRRKEMQQQGGSDAIAAAIERVKAQKAQLEPTDNSVKPAIAAAIARAKAKQAEAAQSGASEPDNSEMAKLREERKRQARERKAQKGEVTEASTSDDADDKKSAVAAAIARAKARKAEQQETESAAQPAQATPSSNEADPKKAAVAAAIARAKARKAEQGTESTAQPAQATPSSDEADPKKAAVAAAIARAKARKAEQQETESAAQPAQATPSSDDADPKKAAVAAAIARAKARKAEQQETESAAQPAQATPSSDDADPKKAAVAAAIARAKARKAEQQETKSTAQPAQATPSSDDADPKKAAVAAAIARAKARKAEQQETESAAQPTQATPSSDDADPKKAAVAAAIARAKARKAAQQSSSNLNAEEKD